MSRGQRLADSSVRTRIPSLLAGLLALGCLTIALGSAVLGDHVDFDVYAAAGDVFLRGGSPYSDLQGLPFTYPPFALLIAAVAALAPVVTLAVLQLLTLAVAGVTPWLSLRPGQVVTWVLVAVCAVSIVTEPVRRSLQLGQLNGLILALVVADFTVVPRRFRGVATGLAAGIKLTPLVFLLVFLTKGQWGGMARMLATFAGTVATSVLLVGDPRATWAALLDPARVGNPAFIDNQSLLGAIRRIMPAEAATTTWFVASLVVLVLTVIVLRSVRDRPDLDAVLVCALGGLLVSPISWSHHWVLAFPLAVTLAARVRAAAWGRAWRGLTMAVLVAAGAVLVAGPHWLVGRRYWETGPHTPGGLVLAASMTIAGLALLAVSVATRSVPAHGHIVGAHPGRRRRP